MSDDEYIAAYIAKNCSTEPCEFYSHGVNGLRIGRNGGLASALDQMDAFLRNRLKCSLAVKQRRHGAVPWHLAADAATSSARARSIGGTSRPRVFAAFRLMTNSNLIDCTIGRSAEPPIDRSMQQAYSPI